MDNAHGRFGDVDVYVCSIVTKIRTISTGCDKQSLAINNVGQIDSGRPLGECRGETLLDLHYILVGQ